jgi:hypothetical protein
MMTLDEYRASQHSFQPEGKVIPEEIIESMYKSYLSSFVVKEEDDFIEPYSPNLDSFNSKEDYHSKLSELFKIGNLKVSELGILIQPSFEPETFIVLSDNSINIKVTKENVWHSKSSDFEIIESTDSNLNNLYKQLDEFIFTAKVHTIKKMVLDGIRLYVFSPKNQQIEVLLFDNPDKESKSGKYITELFNCIEVVCGTEIERYEY